MTTLTISPIPTTTVLFTDTERKPLKQQAKNLETALTILGVDGFVKQHETARRTEVTKYNNAQFCSDTSGDINFKYDRQFSSPRERYYHILDKAEYYQQDSVIDNFTKEETDKFDKSIKKRKARIANIASHLEQEAESIQKDIENRDLIIKQNTVKELLYKINFFKNLFKESQEIHTKRI